MTRRTHILGLIAAWGLTLCASAWGAAPPEPHFAGEPDDALVRKLEPGPGFSLAVAAGTTDPVSPRWRLAATETTELTATDPATGLVVRQQRRWLPDLRLLLIDTTLANQGKTPANVRKLRVGDWTFRVGDDQDSARYRPLTWRNATWYDSTYWTGPGWTRVGKDWHHPGTHTPAIRRFTCPRTGKVTITGRVCKAHVDPKTDGVRLFVRHGARTVWKAEIDGGDAKGVEPKLALDVRKGDAIRFIVHKRGAISCDTTHWDPVVAYADGTRTQASKSFATKRMGAGGWSYEMEVDPQSATGLPTLRAFGLDLTLRVVPLVFGKPVAVSSQEALPVLVVADGADKSGLVLAVAERGAWRLDASLSKDGRLRVSLAAGSDLTLKAGESARLPRLVFGAYRGAWAAGLTTLRQLLDSDGHRAHVGGLRSQIGEALGRAEPWLGMEPELDLWAMVLADWAQQDKLNGSAKSYADATARHIDKARQLLAALRRPCGAGFLAAEGGQLDQFASQAARPETGLAGRRSLYVRVRALKRRIALANPLMQFGKLAFCKRVPVSYSHLVMQYYGWRQRPGGGLFVLEKPGLSLATRQVFDAAKGNVLEPRLSCDATKIVFSYVECPDGPLHYGPLLNDVDEGFYHVWEIGTDGTGLRQISRGPYDDMMPTWLPDGGIAFCSTRRKGYARCFGGQFSRRWHVYTLHRMEADGSRIRTLSFHDTNEWFPTVANTGHILYARWDYIDRDAVTHQNLWATRPDGTNPLAVWGNATPKPHCTFQAKAIPNSHKILFTAAAHHSIAAGPICILDPAVHDNAQDAVTRITPEIPFPEAESRAIREYYAAPWPLSEDYYLVAYSPMPLQWEPRANFANALGIYLLDRFGNRELLYRDPEIGATNPCPLAPRPRPPILKSQLPDRESKTGEMVVLDVHQGLGDVPRGTIKALRIVQIFPKTTHVANSPPIGMAREENARALLGTVPVEPDGSARFLLPAGAPVAFQALDADGLAYQTMHSLTYVQPGERVACIGCHEHRRQVPSNTDALALRRPPSRIDPGPLGGRPFSFVEVVQPVLSKHCVKCHSGDKPKKGIDLSPTPHKGFTRSYASLCGGTNFWGLGTNPKNAAEALVPRMGARNQVQITPPGGLYGARGSRLLKMLRKGHNDVKLTPDELRRLATWIDLNAIFYGAYSPTDQARQLRGETLAMPEIQ